MMLTFFEVLPFMYVYFNIRYLFRLKRNILLQSITIILEQNGSDCPDCVPTADNQAVAETIKPPSRGRYEQITGLWFSDFGCGVAGIGR